MALTLTYIGSTASSSHSGGTYTFAGVSIGSASSDRLVIVVAHLTGGTSDTDFDAINIAGSAATIHSKASIEFANTAIASRVVPSGTTATIQVDMAADTSRCAIEVYTLTDYESATPSDTDFSAIGDSGDTITNTIDIPDGGVAIFGTSSAGGTETHSWSDATEQYDGNIDGSTSRSGATLVGPETAHVETITQSGSTSNRAMVSASWAPGAAVLEPPLLTNLQTFHAATVAPGSIALTAPLLTNAQTFHAATLAPGAVSLSAPLLTNAQTFFGPTIDQFTLLAPPLLTNLQTFHAATVTPGSVALAPALLTNVQTFHAATASASYAVTAPLLTNAQTFFGADVNIVIPVVTPASRRAVLPISRLADRRAVLPVSRKAQRRMTVTG